MLLVFASIILTSNPPEVSMPIVILLSFTSNIFTFLTRWSGLSLYDSNSSLTITEFTKRFLFHLSKEIICVYLTHPQFIHQRTRFLFSNAINCTSSFSSEVIISEIHPGSFTLLLVYN